MGVVAQAAGTGAFLVEVLRRIDINLQDKGMGALVGSQLKAAAMNRVFGFEILTAPFVVAHLQLGLLLQNLGVPLSDEQERVGVYLTNALTGWEPPKQPKQLLLFPELEEERDAADKVKQERPILVVLGNPPYNGFAGVAIGEERDLSNAYRTTKKAPKPEGQGLNELYMRFFRMAERRIIEQTGRGVVCFISNYSWLEGLSFTGMRERYVEAFNSIWIDNLHGDRIISEYAPDGRTSETVFAMQGTSVGIKVGTAIGLLISKDSKESIDECKILYRDMHQARARNRRQALLESIANVNPKESYKTLEPIVDLGFPLKPIVVSPDYLRWLPLPEIFPVSFPGVTTSRDPLVVDIDREQLVKRIEKYFDPKLSHEEMQNISPVALKETPQFEAKATRERLQKRGFLRQNVVSYCYRPFDARWLYWEPDTKLLDRNRADYFPHVFDGNVWLGAAKHNRRDFYPPFVSGCLSSYHVIERGANFFPLKLRVPDQGDLLAQLNTSNPVVNGLQFNLSEAAIYYLNDIGTLDDADHLFYHILSILYAPLYSNENSGALRLNWARIPLPRNRQNLVTSAILGRQVAALLDSKTSVFGVTSKLRSELKTIAVVSGVGTGNLNPNTDFALDVNWGYAVLNGIQPGKAKVIDRPYTPEEQTAIAQFIEQLGTATHNIYLNDIAYWKNIPDRVWSYTIGGYQVIKKWLSYREQKLLGRSLKQEEVLEVTQMARRIAAILLLEPELDANYEAVKQATYPWSAQKQ